MRYANWALMTAFYLTGITMGCVLMVKGDAMNGELGGALGAASVLFLMLPSFILWQDRCLSKADERARAGLATITDTFKNEMVQIDGRHQAEQRSLSIQVGAALARAEAAETALAKLNQGPKARRLLGPSIPRID